MHSLIGKLLGRDDVDAIDGVRLSFGADWAHSGPAWLLFGCLALGFLGAIFYLKFQPRASRRLRMTLGFVRGTLLCLLLLILADPILEVAFSSHPRPVLWVLLDGTESMTIEDRLTADEQLQLREQFGSTDAANNDSVYGVSRSSLVQQWLKSSGANLSNELAEKFQIEFFQFRDADEVSELAEAENADAGSSFDGEQLAEQYQPDGSVTSISSALDDLRRRHISTNLAGVVLVSDFGHNSGAAPLEAARRVGVPIHTVGVGAKQAVDLGVDLQTPLTMKKAETSTVIASVRQQELTGTSATVRVFAKPVEVGTDRISERSIPIGERTVELPGPSTIVEFPFTPEEAGRFAFVAEVEPVDGEIVEQNNKAEREVTVIDDFLRLMFVE